MDDPAGTGRLLLTSPEEKPHTGPTRAANPSLSSIGATDASAPATTLLSHGSSSPPLSPCSSESESESSGDIYDARNRRFPPLLPSTRRIPEPSRLAAQLASLAARSATGGSSAAESATETDESEDEEEENSEGQTTHSDGNGDGNNGDDGDDDGEADDEDSREVQALWVRLRDQRMTVRKLRVELSQRRARLRELRRQKDSVDNSFMGLVRPHLVSGHALPYPDDRIIQCFEDMQRVRNEYHFEESEVEHLEDELDREELARETLETQFFTIVYGAAGGSGHRDPSPSKSIADSYSPPSRTSLLGIPADRPVDIHPLYKQLLDAVGDRELAKEHLTELMMHRDSILYNLELAIKRERLRDAEGRQDKLRSIPDSDSLESLRAIAEDPDRLDEIIAKHNLVIEKEDYDFLKEFKQEQPMLWQKVIEAKEEVDRLRQLCIEKGVMRKNAPYHEEYTIFFEAEEPFATETMSINQGQAPRRESSLANPRFPILLSNPRHVLEPEPLTPKGALKATTKLPSDDPTKTELVADAVKEYGISTLVVESSADDKSDYINRWLLHRLRISPLEVELLYTIFSESLKVHNIRRWQQDVLYYWSRDEANHPKEKFGGPVTTRDVLIVEDDLASNINSALISPSPPGSNLGDSLDQRDSVPTAISPKLRHEPG